MLKIPLFVKKTYPVDLFRAALLKGPGAGVQGSAGGDHIVKEEYLRGGRFDTADSAPEVGYPVFPVKSLLGLGGKPFQAAAYREAKRGSFPLPALFFQQPCQVFNLIPAVMPKLSRPGGNGYPGGIFHPFPGKSRKTLRELFREKIPQAPEFTEFIGPEDLLVLPGIGKNRKGPVKKTSLPLPAGKTPVLFRYEGTPAEGTAPFVPRGKGGPAIPAEPVPGIPGV
jgi:hypothetical protein